QLVFISDLHLEPEAEDITRAYLQFMQRLKIKAQQQKIALFILGDFFEAWIGDDAIAHSSWLQHMLAPLTELTRLAPVYFMHGNRDFLIGSTFAAATGVKCLPEVYTFDFHGFHLALCHGDHLCTQDQSYMAFRKQVRSKDWQAHF